MKNNSLVMITYTLAGGEKIDIEVTVEVAITISDSERAVQSQRRKERKYLDFAGYIEGETELYSKSKKRKYPRFSRKIRKLPKTL